MIIYCHFVAVVNENLKLVMKLLKAIFLWILSMHFCVAQDMHLGEMVRNTDVFKIDIKKADQINLRGPEFSPVYYKDGLLFVSARSKGITLKDKTTNEAMFDLFYAPFDQEGMPQRAEIFSSNISSPRHHIGKPTLSLAQDLIFFSRNSRPIDPTAKRPKKPGDNVQQIFEASKGPQDWVNIRLLEFNSDSFSIVHPALSPDNSKLYFSSDMVGGYGGWDLYFVERLGDSWSAPINLGPTVNTSRNELFPFVAANGDLYFSSNGHRGLGGLDLFVSRHQGANLWSTPSNIGEPINSRWDDFGICLAPNGFEGFFSSDRPGGKGKDDIYRLRVELKDELPYVQSQVVFIDQDSRQRLDGVSVRIYEMLPNGSLAVTCPFYSFIDEDGEVAYNRKERAVLDVPAFKSDINGTATPQLFKQKQYLLVADKEGYMRSFTEVDGSTKEARINMELEPEEDCVEINAFVISNQNDQEEPLEKATIILVNRTTKERSTQESRRDGSFTICLMRRGDYEISIQKPGYINKKEILRVNGLREAELIEKKYIMEPSKGLEDASIEEGAVIVLNNIYYDYNSAELRRDATKELDDLAVVMKRFPSMKIELISHTDSRGDWLYNQELSLKRAQSAKRYMVENKSIKGDRIQALGYGESQIRNHCLDGIECTEEEHGFNRRTEVRIISVTDNIRVEYDDGLD